jgi:hypothetical protein
VSFFKPHQVISLLVLQSEVTRVNRLIIDDTVVRVRLDRKATSISLLVVLGVRRDGQKVLLAVKNIGGESEVLKQEVEAVMTQFHLTIP